MKLETLATIFEMFFPGITYQVTVDNLDTLLTAVIDNKKYSVEYDQEENHLQVWSIDLNERFSINYIIEGSPEDIIKLAKLLQ
jgi:DNA polymerase I-like protein with 3'-5' exonuclease and polymerase domains